MTDRSSSAANVVDLSSNPALLIQGKPSFQYASDVTSYVRANGRLPDWFSPMAPLAPVAPADLAGRQWDYQAGYNVNTQPKVGQGISFSKLRMMSRSYDLLRLIIETRKDEICTFDWSIQPEDENKNPDARCDAIRKMFKRPDGRHTWKQWLRAVLEDALVCDAACVYPRKNVGGQVISLDLIDGTTIKPIIDDFGRTPLDPYPAYQQYLKGVPAFQYLTSELVYMPRNVSTDRVYGYSPVEQLIMLVNIALRRETHQLSYYTEGSTPDLILSVPPDWTPQQVAEFEKYWNSQLSGQLGERRKTKFVFDGVKGLNTKEAALTDKYDEWLARLICYCFGMSPQPFVSMMNRATANTAKEAEKETGLGPWLEWVEDFMTYIIQFHMGFDDLCFKWSEEDETDPATKAKIYDMRLRNGSMSINEYRNEMGEDLLDDDLGGKYLIYTATGAVPLEQVLEPPEPAPAPGEPNAAVPNPTSGDKQSASSGGSNPPKATKVATSQKKISAAVRKVFKKMPQVVADQLRPHIGIMKMSSENRARAGAMTSGLDLSEFGDLMDAISKELEKTFGERMSAAWEGVGGADVNTDMIDQRAVDYASERAGELISTDADGGELGDATRLLIRGTIEQALDEGWTVDELAAELADSYAFSDDRADTIAETETADAMMQADLAGWKESGVVTSKVWLLSNDEGVCDECEGNEAQGEIPLDDDFDSGDDAPPAHPNCRCSMAAITDDGSEEED